MDIRSQPHGGGGGGPFSMKCPQNDYVTQITGRSGKRLDNIGIQCKGGRRLAKGGGGGGAFTHSCPAGYNKMSGRNGSRVDQVTFNCSTGGSITKGGGGGGFWGTFKCLPGWVLSEVFGRSGSEIDQIGFGCTPKSQAAKVECCTGKRNCAGYKPGSTCDNIMLNYCKISGNKNKTICSCINSPFPQPQCIDAICSNKGGYRTRGMQNMDCNLTYYDCKQAINTEKSEGTLFDAVKFQQYCGAYEPKTKEPPTPTPTPTPTLYPTPIPTQPIQKNNTTMYVSIFVILFILMLLFAIVYIMI